MRSGALMDELTRQLYLRQTRRSFLGAAAKSIGGVALASLIDPSLVKAGPATTQAAHAPDHWNGILNPLHFAPKAKRVIHLYMAGGPSHLETFDYRPKLAEMTGKPMPDS